MSFQIGTRMSYLNWGQNYISILVIQNMGKFKNIQKCYVSASDGTSSVTLHTCFPWENQLHYKILLESELDVKMCYLIQNGPSTHDLKIGPVASPRTVINVYLLQGITFQENVIFTSQSLSYHEKTTWKTNEHTSVDL